MDGRGRRMDRRSNASGTAVKRPNEGRLKAWTALTWTAF
jgi:hypothetical protein